VVPISDKGLMQRQLPPEKPLTVLTTSRGVVAAAAAAPAVPPTIRSSMTVGCSMHRSQSLVTCLQTASCRYWRAHNLQPACSVQWHPLKQQRLYARKTIFLTKANLAITCVNAHVSLGASLGALGKFRPSFAAWMCKSNAHAAGTIPMP